VHMRSNWHSLQTARGTPEKLRPTCTGGTAATASLENDFFFITFSRESLLSGNFKSGHMSQKILKLHEVSGTD
jgi:hypothetical protein